MTFCRMSRALLVQMNGLGVGVVMREVFTELGLRGQLHQLGHIHLGWRRPTRKIAFDAGNARLDVALAPATRLDPVNAQFLGDLQVLQTLRGQQGNAGTFCQPHTAHLGVNQPHQLGFVLPPSIQSPGQLARSGSDAVRSRPSETRC